MRIDSLLQGQIANLTGSSDIASRLNPGDVIRAQLIDIMANEVVLKLFDGTTLKASIMADIDAGKGEFANFVVKDKLDNQIILEQQKATVLKSENLDNKLLKQLASIGIEANEQNIQIAEKMNSNFVPFNKNIFDNILGMMDKFKDLGAAKAVFLASNNMVPTEKNVEALSQLVDAKMQLGSQIEQIKRSMEDISSSKTSTPIDLDNEIAAMKNFGLKMSGINEKVKELIGKAMTMSGDSFDSQLEDFINELPAEVKLSDKSAIADFIRNIAAKLKFSGQDRSIDNSTSDTKKFEEFKKELDNIFIKLDSKNLEKDIDIKEAYKEIYKKLEDIKESIPMNSITLKNELVQKLDNVQNQMRFINDINSHSTYIQIPINMSNANSTGELYILKRDSKKRKINPEDTTMLIALNTQNIGRVESLITVNKRNISLNMRVEDQNIISIFKENYRDLYNRINEKGYKLADVKYRIIDSQIDVVNVNEIIQKDLNKDNKKVDIKI